jgi:hypothetical protein
MEELFVARRHWMLCSLAGSRAVFSVSLQILGRLGELAKDYGHPLEQKRQRGNYFGEV